MKRVTRGWLQGMDSNHRPRAYEARQIPLLTPCNTLLYFNTLNYYVLLVQLEELQLVDLVQDKIINNITMV